MGELLSIYKLIKGKNIRCIINLLFLLDIFFIYISNVIPFPGSLQNPPITSPCFYECAPTCPLLLLSPFPGINVHWAIKSTQDLGPLLPAMPNMTILCYICTWGHGLLHLYSLVGDLVLGSSGVSCCLILLFSL